MKEEEIRPKKIFDEYLSLAKKDTEIYFSDVEKFMVSVLPVRSEITYDKTVFL